MPWDVTIPENQQDEELREHLLAELVRWIVEGAKCYLESGLREPKRVMEASRSVMASCNPVGRWLEECTIADPSAFSKSSDLYENYKQWASQEGEITILTWKTIVPRLEERGYKEHKSSGLMGRRGIRLNDNRDHNTIVPVDHWPVPPTSEKPSSPSYMSQATEKPVSTFTPTPGTDVKAMKAQAGLARGEPRLSALAG